MKRSLNALVATFAVLAFGNFLGAIPPGPGSQHIRFSGTEVMTVLGPEFAYFSTMQTISIPSLQLDEYILVLEQTTAVFEWLADGVYTSGTALIKSPDGSEVVGAAGYILRTRILGPGPLLPFTGVISVAGVIWGGPLAGLVITENILTEGTTDPWTYNGLVDGFFIVPEHVDMKKLKASLAD